MVKILSKLHIESVFFLFCEQHNEFPLSVKYRTYYTLIFTNNANFEFLWSGKFCGFVLFSTALSSAFVKQLIEIVSFLLLIKNQKKTVAFGD